MADLAGHPFHHSRTILCTIFGNPSCSLPYYIHFNAFNFRFVVHPKDTRTFTIAVQLMRAALPKIMTTTSLSPHTRTEIHRRRFSHAPGFKVLTKTLTVFPPPHPYKYRNQPQPRGAQHIIPKVLPTYIFVGRTNLYLQPLLVKHHRLRIFRLHLLPCRHHRCSSRTTYTYLCEISREP